MNKTVSLPSRINVSCVQRESQLRGWEGDGPQKVCLCSSCNQEKYSGISSDVVSGVYPGAGVSWRMQRLENEQEMSEKEGRENCSR
jgi:hypothetical protein